MVGSSDSVSSPNVVLNTIVAEAFKEAADELENSDDFDSAVHDMIKRLFAEHRRIISAEMVILRNGLKRQSAVDFRT